MKRPVWQKALLVWLFAANGVCLAATTTIHVVLDGANASGAQVFIDAQFRGQTNEQGILIVDRALLQNSHTVITARLKVYEVPAFLPGHDDAESPAGWVMRAYVTTVAIDNSGIVHRFVVTDNTVQQELVLERDNALIGLQVLVSADWDMAPVEFTHLAEAFQWASRYLWNATDGQFIFERVRISDLTQNWDRSEYRFWADNTLRARTTPGGFLNQNLLGSLVGSFINISWRDPSIHHGQGPIGPSWGISWGGDDPRTFVHEFGHLGFSLHDEYGYTVHESCTSRRTNSDPDVFFRPFGEKAACIMDSQFESAKFCSDQGPNSHQYVSLQPDDCWAGIRGSFSDPQGSRWILKTPVTRNQLLGTLVGASSTSADAFPAEWNTAFTVTNKGWSSPLCKPFLQSVNYASGIPAERSTIKLLYTSIDPSKNSWISEGKTFQDGTLAILGAHVGDTVMTETAFTVLSTCPEGTWPEGTLGTSTADSDSDGVPDDYDTCPNRFNPYTSTSFDPMFWDQTNWPTQTTIACSCKSNLDCPRGLGCADAGGGAGLQCTSPSCRTDDDCGAGRQCMKNATGAMCVAIMGTHCTTNAECGSGRCDVGDRTSKTGLCVATQSSGQPGTLCTDDRQCASGNCGGLRPDSSGGWRPGVCVRTTFKGLGEYCFNSAQCNSGYCDVGDRTSKTHLCMTSREGLPGDLCSDNRQCASGNCGGLAPGADGAWQPGHCSASSHKGLGEYCFGNGDCTSGNCDAGLRTSNTNRCMPNKDGQFGQICSNDNQCLSLYCSGLSNGGGVVTGTCGSTKPLGASCTASTQCISGYCDGGPNTSQTYRCMPNHSGQIGDICSNDNQCGSHNCVGLFQDHLSNWVPGACAIPSARGNGDYCSSNTQCTSDYCDVGDRTSKTQLCMKGRNGQTGDLCSNDNQCTSGNCGGLAPDAYGGWQPGHCSASSQKALGESCFGNGQCGSGNCDAGPGTSKTDRCMPNKNGKSGDICSNNNQCTSRVCVGLHAEGNNWIPGQCQ